MFPRLWGSQFFYASITHIAGSPAENGSSRKLLDQGTAPSAAWVAWVRLW